MARRKFNFIQKDGSEFVPSSNKFYKRNINTGLIEEVADETAISTEEVLLSGTKSDIRKGELLERNISVLKNRLESLDMSNVSISGSSGSVTGSNIICEFTATDGQTTFTDSRIVDGLTTVYMNGFKIHPSYYNIVDTTLTLLSIVAKVNDVIIVDIQTYVASEINVNEIIEESVTLVDTIEEISLVSDADGQAVITENNVTITQESDQPNWQRYQAYAENLNGTVSINGVEQTINKTIKLYPSFKELFENGLVVNGAVEPDLNTNIIYTRRLVGSGKMPINTLPGVYSKSMQEIKDLGYSKVEFTLTQTTNGMIVVGDPYDTYTAEGDVTKAQAQGFYGTNNTLFTFDIETKKLSYSGAMDSRYTSIYEYTDMDLSDIRFGMIEVQSNTGNQIWDTDGSVITVFEPQTVDTNELSLDIEVTTLPQIKKVTFSSKTNMLWTTLSARFIKEDGSTLPMIPTRLHTNLETTVTFNNGTMETNFTGKSGSTSYSNINGIEYVYAPMNAFSTERNFTGTHYTTEDYFLASNGRSSTTPVETTFTFVEPQSLSEIHINVNPDTTYSDRNTTTIVKTYDEDGHILGEYEFVGQPTNDSIVTNDIKSKGFTKLITNLWVKGQ